MHIICIYVYKYSVYKYTIQFIYLLGASASKAQAPLLLCAQLVSYLFR